MRGAGLGRPVGSLAEGCPGLQRATTVRQVSNELALFEIVYASDGSSPSEQEGGDAFLIDQVLPFGFGEPGQVVMDHHRAAGHQWGQVGLDG